MSLISIYNFANILKNPENSQIRFIFTIALQLHTVDSCSIDFCYITVSRTKVKISLKMEKSDSPSQFSFASRQMFVGKAVAVQQIVQVMWRKIQSYQLLMELLPLLALGYRHTARTAQRPFFLVHCILLIFIVGFMETFMAILKNLSMALTCLLVILVAARKAFHAAH